jgi:excisionase family DNA binding protein
LKTREQHWCPRYVTTSFVAENCGVSTVTVLSWIEELRLPAFRLPKGHYRICRDDFIEFMEKYKMPMSGEEYKKW